MKKREIALLAKLDKATKSNLVLVKENLSLKEGYKKDLQEAEDKMRSVYVKNQIKCQLEVQRNQKLLGRVKSLNLDKLRLEELQVEAVDRIASLEKETLALREEVRALKCHEVSVVGIPEIDCSLGDVEHGRSGGQGCVTVCDPVHTDPPVVGSLGAKTSVSCCQSEMLPVVSSQKTGDEVVVKVEAISVFDRCMESDLVDKLQEVIIISDDEEEEGRLQSVQQLFGSDEEL